MIRPSAAGTSRYVNVGCGSRAHDAWLNLDVAPAVPGVRAWDAERGLPLADASCAAVYHSHVLEHLRRDAVLPFLAECRRVLEAGGVLRVVVPDLEDACRAYLAALERARAGAPGAAQDHEWMTTELVDQLARERSGGEMLAYLRRRPANDAFVRSRLGEEAGQVFDGAARASPWRHRLRYLPGALRHRYEKVIATALLGPRAARALAIGRFRLSGEAHQWMYDAHSLGQLLSRAGFGRVVAQTAHASLIPEWPSFHLDVSAEGHVVRPNSLYLEAVKEA